MDNLINDIINVCIQYIYIKDDRSIDRLYQLMLAKL